MLLVAGCTYDADLDPQLHGQVPVNDTNFPANPGENLVTTQEVVYHDNVSGYLARPADGRDYPGVVMIHEWWGLNDNIKDMAKQLASDGYIVLAVDLYEGEVAQTSEEARSLVQAFDANSGLENMNLAVQYLKDNGATSVGSLGWCFGGGQSLQLALAEDLDAAVIYYGSLVTDEEELLGIDEPILGIFGAQDSSIPVSQVREFNESLSSLGVERQIHIYEDAGHAFANPSGDRYVKGAAEDAWQKTISFLAENLE